MNELRWIIQCRRDPQPFFETIAGFNCEPVAKRYAGECYKTNPDATYRVLELPEAVEPEAVTLHQFGPALS